jgi:S-adenosylmethionine hydrolase
MPGSRRPPAPDPACARYAEAAPGELLALVDSYGALEIAVREGNAARASGSAAATPSSGSRSA